jgi:tRNA nucleotidyltransferase (CCA-adding enzyme)
VRPGTAEEDLRRRDFTVNAIAVGLGGIRRGELRAVPTALEDLAARRLRVLHEQSFRDDPTRLLRLARYSSRLGFSPDERTSKLAAEAVAAGALHTISRARFGAELRLALAEPDPVSALAAFDSLGALAALDPAMRFDAPLAVAALAELPGDGRKDALLLAILLSAPAGAPGEDEPALRALLDGLELSAGEREPAIRAALDAPLLAASLARALSAAELYDVAGGQTVEAIALAAALGEARGEREVAPAARRWLSDLREVRLQINGEDLLAAGIAPGPEVGRRLEQALRRKLDGELAGGREAELSAAMAGT